MRPNPPNRPLRVPAQSNAPSTTRSRCRPDPPVGGTVPFSLSSCGRSPAPALTPLAHVDAAALLSAPLQPTMPVRAVARRSTSPRGTTGSPPSRRLVMRTRPPLRLLVERSACAAALTHGFAVPTQPLNHGRAKEYRPVLPPLHPSPTPRLCSPHSPHDVAARCFAGAYAHVRQPHLLPSPRHHEPVPKAVKPVFAFALARRRRPSSPATRGLVLVPPLFPSPPHPVECRRLCCGFPCTCSAFLMPPSPWNVPYRTLPCAHAVQAAATAVLPSHGCVMPSHLAPA